MGKRAIALGIATLVALVGVFAVFAYVSAADRRAVADQKPTEVWVTSKVVPAGTTLEDAVAQELLTKTTVAAKGAPKGALGEVTDENADLVALSQLVPGEFVLADRFGTQPKGEKAIEVDEGKVAISLQLPEPERVGTFVTPGSKIVIYATKKLVDLSQSERAKVINEHEFKQTRVLLHDVEVIAMGKKSLALAPSPEEGEEQQPEQPTYLVTVQVTPQQSVELVHGIQTADLYAGLQGPKTKWDDVDAVDDLTILAPIEGIE